MASGAVAGGRVGIFHPASLYADLRERLDRAAVTVVDVSADDHALGDVDVVLSHPWFRVDEPVLERAPHLRSVMAPGAGYDGIDVAAATRRGVLVTRQADDNAVAVAEHAIGLVLALVKRIAHGDRVVRSGADWYPGQSDLVNDEVRGRRLGIIGLGAIGAQTARIASVGLGMQVRAADPYARPTEHAAIVDHDELLAWSEVLSVHVALTDATRHLVGREALARLPRGAVLVNTSRGGVVDLDAVVAALRAGHLSGAGLDVFEGDRLDASHPIRTLPNVVLTPHIAGAARQSQARRAGRQLRAVLDVLDGRPPTTAEVVNPDALSGFASRLGNRPGARA